MTPFRPYQFITVNGSPDDYYLLDEADVQYLYDWLNTHGVSENDAFQVVTSPEATWVWRYLKNDNGNHYIGPVLDEVAWQLDKLPSMWDKVA